MFVIWKLELGFCHVNCKSGTPLGAAGKIKPPALPAAND